MDEQNFNSLADRLKQNGIIFSDDKIVEDIDVSENNFFKNPTNGNFKEYEIQENKKNDTKKRINQYDLELIKRVSIPNVDEKSSNIKFVEHLLNFKNSLNKNDKIDFFRLCLNRFFPKIYQAKLIKQAISKLKQLNIDANELLDKTIPYGENKSRYENLVKYLNFANEIQSNLQDNR